MPILGTVASQFSGKPFSSFESIATVTVGSGGQSTMTFSSIPSTYTHLQLRGLIRNSNASAGSLDMHVRFNGDSGATNYTAYHIFYGQDTSTKGSAASFNTNHIAGAYFLRDGNSANYFTPVIFDIFDYRNTNKFKSTKSFFGSNPASTNGRTAFAGGLWKNTSAITSIDLTVEGGFNFVQYSKFALYGIKGA
jgi:hypothetical protein